MSSSNWLVVLRQCPPLVEQRLPGPVAPAPQPNQPDEHQPQRRPEQPDGASPPEPPVARGDVALPSDLEVTLGQVVGLAQGRVQRRVARQVIDEGLQPAPTPPTARAAGPRWWRAHRRSSHPAGRPGAPGRARPNRVASLGPPASSASARRGGPTPPRPRPRTPPRTRAAAAAAPACAAPDERAHGGGRRTGGQTDGRTAARSCPPRETRPPRSTRAAALW